MATGKTQKEFAAMLGIGRESILSIELGRMKMPSDLALKIRVETGCCLTESTGRRGERIFDVKAVAADTLKKYTPIDFRGHREAMDEFYNSDSEELISMCQGATRAIDLMLHAANRRGGGVMLAFVKDFENFLARTFESFRLASFLEGYVRESYESSAPAKVAAKSFPLAPLSTAYPFPSSVEMDVASKWKSSKSDAKVMPKKPKALHRAR
jgi:DNA-binding XRE family transcriptional regulator